MSEQSAGLTGGAQPEPTPDGQPGPPVTGIDQIDQATARLAALGDSPLTEHQDRLAEAQLALHEALHSDHPHRPEG